jgi:uncharacterized RDD family membrane protein YckC
MRMNYAGALPRVCAILVDLSLLYGLMRILQKGMLLWELDESTYLHIVLYLTIAVIYTYFLVRFSATPGKMLFNLRIVMHNQRPLSIGAVSCRCVVVVSFYATLQWMLAGAYKLTTIHQVWIGWGVFLAWIFGCCGLLLLRHNRQVLHDILSGTVVIQAHESVE